MKSLAPKLLLTMTILLMSTVIGFCNHLYLVNTEKLNVRRGINTSPPFGYFKYGDTIEAVSTNNPKWYKVKIQSREGYVRSKYLLPVIQTADRQSNVNWSLIIWIGIIGFSITVCIVALFTNKKVPDHPIDSSGQVTVVVKHKSVGLAILLTFFFGPLGMFYSTAAGGLIMSSFPIMLIILSGVNNAGLNTIAQLLLAGIFVFGIFYWFICIIWAAVAAGRSKKVIINQYQPTLNSNES